MWNELPTRLATAALLAALLANPRSTVAQSGWRPVLSSSVLVEGTSGTYYAMGGLLSVDARLGIERRETGIAPLLALAASAGRGTDQLGGLTCVFDPCLASSPPWVQTAMLWTGARMHRTTSAVTTRIMVGAGLIRVNGVGTDPRDGTNAARGSQLGVRGEIDYAINDRYGVLFGAQYIDASTLEAGLRRGGLSVGIRRH
jgi:hypothetical protein